MRWLLLFTSFVFGELANHLAAQEPIRSTQSTNRADSRLIEEISRKLDELSPIQSLVHAMPIKQLMSMYPITIVFDERALEEESITVDEPITLPQVKGITIRNQLKIILEPLQLTYVELPGYLLVTSKKSSANVVRLYDVTSVVSFVRGGFNFAPLIGIIERSIAEDNWQSAGGNSNMSVWQTNDVAILVVSAPGETHESIRDLFSAHRELLNRSKSVNTTRKLHSTELRPSNVRHSWLRRNAD